MGGVHTYVASFVPAMIELAGDHEIILYADTKRPFELIGLPKYVEVRYLPYRNPVSSITNDLRLKHWMARDKLDVAHFPANFGFAPAGTKSVITLHDEINVMPWLSIVRGHRRDARTIGMMTYLHWASRLSVRRADRILTVSAYARVQITRYSGFDPERITVVHSAPAAEMRRIDDPDAWQSVGERHQIDRPFVLADALKNPGVLVRAWELLSPDVRSQHRIVFFCRRPQVPAAVDDAVRAGYARLLVRPSTQELAVLYSNARAFVFPSWIEGFGLPILEAMTCGAPVIASDRGAIPEVAGGAALLMEAEDDTALAGHLRALLLDPAQADHFRQMGFCRAAQFSWTTTAQHVLGCYEQVMRVNGTNRSEQVLA